MPSSPTSSGVPQRAPEGMALATDMGAGERQAAAPADIINWPAVLRNPCFAEQRLRVEAPYRRDSQVRAPRTAADFRDMIDAAGWMKSTLEPMRAQISPQEYAYAVRFLDQLVAEAKERLEQYSLLERGGDSARPQREAPANAGGAAVAASFESGTSAGAVQLAQHSGHSEGSTKDNSHINALIAEILEPEPILEVEVHRSKLLRTKVPVSRVSITEPKTLDIVQYSPTEFELIGHHPGQTSLTFWYGDNQALRYFVRVKPGPYETEVAKEYRELQDKINEMFPNSMVQLIPIADKLIVRGQARDSAEATQILSVLSSGRRGDATGSRGGAVGGYGGVGRMLDLGAAASPRPGSDLPVQSLINLLDVPGEQQVMLKVRVAELSRTALRRLTTQFKINSGILALNTDSGGLSAVFSSVLTPQDLRLALTAVTTSGYAKILAEPNLVTLNGQPASFLSGGEFPVPTAVGIGGVSGINTQFHSFGTQVTFTPTIIDKDRIRLSVAPSFSSVDRDLEVQGVPGTRSRAVTTTVDLRTGQWLAIAGLLQDQQSGSKVRVPFAGDIPVLGALFGQSSSSREETELMILVSPELVHPMDAREAPLILPGMEIAEPSDAAFFLKGAYVGKYDSGQNPRRCPAPCSPQAKREAMSRPDYQRSEKYYLYGENGTSQ